MNPSPAHPTLSAPGGRLLAWFQSPAPMVLANHTRRPSEAPGERDGSEEAAAEKPTARRLFLVEDNAADVDLVREALGALPFQVDVSTAEDGEKALAALHAAARRGAVPDVILLDLNLPRMSGHDVLARLKTDPALCGVPVVVLTSSSAVRDSDGARALRADGFVTKPIDVNEYFRTIQATARRWLRPGRATTADRRFGGDA
jgi:CheY-like chemotaxis protein